KAVSLRQTHIPGVPHNRGGSGTHGIYWAQWRAQSVGRGMNDRDELDLGPGLGRRRMGGVEIPTLGLGVAILFVDGLDYSAANVGAPAILRAFHAEKSAMGAVFGWGYFGIFLGTILFGYIGDKYGRKVGAVLGVLAYSIPALLTPLAESL